MIEKLLKEKNKESMKLYEGSENSRYKFSEDKVGPNDFIKIESDSPDEGEHIANNVTETRSILG